MSHRCDCEDPATRRRSAEATTPSRLSPLEDALKLVHLSEKESPKFKKAAMKFLRRYLDEKKPTLKNFAKVVRGFEEREPEVR